MPRNLTLTALLTCLLLIGCTSNNPKNKTVFSEEQTAELKDIINRNMTDADWEKLQQEYDQFAKKANYKPGVDIRHDYDKNPWVLMLVLEASRSTDNVKLQQELTGFLNRWMSEKTLEEKESEKANQKAIREGQMLMQDIEKKLQSE